MSNGTFDPKEASKFLTAHELSRLPRVYKTQNIMSFNEKIYNDFLIRVKQNLANNNMSPYDYMQEYKRRISLEDYEEAKAITDALAPLKYYTADTHPHIPTLNK